MLRSVRQTFSYPSLLFRCMNNEQLEEVVKDATVACVKKHNEMLRWQRAAEQCAALVSILLLPPAAAQSYRADTARRYLPQEGSGARASVSWSSSSGYHGEAHP